MRITENRLRQVIREVLSEMSDLRPEQMPRDHLNDVVPTGNELKIQIVTGSGGGYLFIGTYEECIAKIKSVLNSEEELQFVFIHEEGPDAEPERLINYCTDININCDDISMYG